VNITPLFVIGPGRGGTSLLTACLDGHPGIVMRSEYHSARILIGDDEPIRSVATLLDDRLARLRSICDEDQARNPGLIWGNKITTEQIRGLEEHNFLNGASEDVVARFVHTMAGYRSIFITRDGRSCVASKAHRAGRPMMRAALSWCYSVRVLERLERLGALCATVRYEDLVRKPQKPLMKVCQALEIDFHPDMLNQTNNEQLLRPEYRHGRFLTEKATEIPLLPDAVLNVIEPDLRRLGYLWDRDTG
jgi:sulfotransferase family protein